MGTENEAIDMSEFYSLTNTHNHIQINKQFCTPNAGIISLRTCKTHCWTQLNLAISQAIWQLLSF